MLWISHLHICLCSFWQSKNLHSLKNDLLEKFWVISQLISKILRKRSHVRLVRISDLFVRLQFVRKHSKYRCIKCFFVLWCTLFELQPFTKTTDDFHWTLRLFNVSSHGNFVLDPFRPWENDLLDFTLFIAFSNASLRCCFSGSLHETFLNISSPIPLWGPNYVLSFLWVYKFMGRHFLEYSNTFFELFDFAGFFTA